MADFEWDSEKELLNLRKHGINFGAAQLIWNGPVSERIDSRRDYGEVRVQAFGIAEDRVLTVIFTWRGQVRRIISARKASFREKSLYEAEIRKSGGSYPD